MNIKRWPAPTIPVCSRFFFTSSSCADVLIGFPSLSPNVQGHLRSLLESQPNPSPESINTWAKIFAQANTGATHQDVETWVHLHMRGQADSPQQPLPTPANTVSPEPSNAKPTFHSGPMSPAQSSFSTSPMQVEDVHVKKSPTQSPLLPPPLSIQTSPFQAYPPQHTSHYQPQLVTPTSPLKSGPAIKTPQRPRVSTLQEAIIQGVADAIVSPALTSPPDTLPTNAAEFNAMFASFEKQLSQLKHALESA